MIENFKYFDWGCAVENQRQYGLYNSVADCFLFVTSDLKVAQKLQTVLSSRYDLSIVALSQAENYTLTLIDNTVCTQWSFQEKSAIDVGDLSYDKLGDIVFATGLCQTTRPNDWNLDGELEYIFVCNHWISAFYNQKRYHLMETPGFDRFLPLPEFANNELQGLISEIHRLMYLGRCAATVDSAIQNLVYQSSIVL